MKSNLTLIQLISEQTMQNLLPVLRLQPTKLVHLATPRTEARSPLIAEAAWQSKCPVELETIRLSNMPSMREAHGAVVRSIEDTKSDGVECIVNFTGGTKLMSIGAYVAALNNKTASLYVDSQEAVFVDGQTGDGLETWFKGDLSFTPILRSLSVHAVAKANGCPRVTGGRDWKKMLPLALLLFQDRELENSTHKAIHGPEGLCPNGREPRKYPDWMQLLSRKIALHPQVATAAVETGLLEPGPKPGPCLFPRSFQEKMKRLTSKGGFEFFKAIEPIQQTLGFLSGGWWEVVVLQKMVETGRFRDVRWSVNVGQRGGADLEEDIVALDGVQITYVSCKRGGQGSRLLPLLDEVRARAQTLGGTFTRCFLAIYQKPTGSTLANLLNRAKSLRIKLLFPENFSDPDPFL